MANFTKTVGTTGDYSTIQAAIDDADVVMGTADLTAGVDEYFKLELQNQEFSISSPLSFAGYTTNATHYFWLTTATGASFADHADKLTNALRYNSSNGAGIVAGTYSSVVQNSDTFCKYQKLQFKGTGSGGTGYELFYQGNSTWVDCILQEDKPNLMIKCRSGTNTFINSLLVHNTSSNIQAINNGDSGNQLNMYNCTLVRPSDKTAGGTGIADTAYSASPLLKNCAVYGFSTNFLNNFSASSVNNSSDGAISFGSSNQASLTYADQFEETSAAAGMDFRAVSTGGLDTTGSRDAANTGDLDIVGQSRSTTTPTIGAWEVVAGGGASAVPLLMMHYN